MPKRTPSSAKAGKRPASAPLPAASGRAMTTKAPRTRSTKDGVRISHSEMLDSVTALVAPAAALTSFPVSPHTFSWLSPIASQYERYHVHKMHVRFETRVGTSSGGFVMLGVDYDPTAHPPGTDVILSSYAGTVETPAYRSATLNLTPSRIHGTTPKLLTRRGTVLELCLGGHIYVYASMDALGVDLGRLWVDYDVEFFTPQIGYESSLTHLTTSTVGFRASNQVIPGGIAAILKVDDWELRYNGLNLPNPDGTGTIRLDQGAYRIDLFQAIDVTTAFGVNLTATFVLNGATQPGCRFRYVDPAWAVGNVQEITITGILLVDTDNTLFDVIISDSASLVLVGDSGSLMITRLN